MNTAKKSPAELKLLCVCGAAKERRHLVCFSCFQKTPKDLRDGLNGFSPDERRAASTRILKFLRAEQKNKTH